MHANSRAIDESPHAGRLASLQQLQRRVTVNAHELLGCAFAPVHGGHVDHGIDACHQTLDRLAVCQLSSHDFDGTGGDGAAG